MKVQLFVNLAVFILSFSAQARPLVISDIDDTIKVAHVLSQSGAVSSALDEKSFFSGMPEIFNALRVNLKNAEFHYVSLAPRVLMEDKHEDFLENQNFPVHGLHLNPGVTQDPELKQQVIRKLIQEKQPSFILYFGDNGQFDPAVYEQMVREFPQIPALIFIREAYSSKGRAQSPTKPGQIKFVTSVDLGMELKEYGLLSDKTLQNVEKIVFNKLRKEGKWQAFGEIVFPWWYDCRDFTWRWDVREDQTQLMYIADAIEKRCR
ncbi:MAG: phosphatase domain-containing protein [Bdellovibrionia bacterium]